MSSPEGADIDSAEDAATVLICRGGVGDQEGDEKTVFCPGDATQGGVLPSSWRAFVAEEVAANSYLREDEDTAPHQVKPSKGASPAKTSPVRRPKESSARSTLLAVLASLGIATAAGTCMDGAFSLAQPPKASAIAESCPDGMKPGSWVLDGGTHALYMGVTPLFRHAEVNLLVGGVQKGSSPAEALWKGCVPETVMGAESVVVSLITDKNTGTYHFVLPEEK